MTNANNIQYLEDWICQTKLKLLLLFFLPGLNGKVERDNPGEVRGFYDRYRYIIDGGQIWLRKSDFLNFGTCRHVILYKYNGHGHGVEISKEIGGRRSEVGHIRVKVRWVVQWTGEELLLRNKMTSGGPTGPSGANRVRINSHTSKYCLA